MKSSRRLSRGFTLVEVLVALGIVAIALVAGLQATAALTRNALRQSDMLLAQVCAENELSRLRLARQMPGTGETAITCMQADQAFEVVTVIAATPNPNFMRVDAQVRSAGQGLTRISTIIGRY